MCHVDTIDHRLFSVNFISPLKPINEIRLLDLDMPGREFADRLLVRDVKSVSNRDGIGTKLVKAGGVVQVRFQSNGMHNKSQNHQWIHFGLAENTIE